MKLGLKLAILAAGKTQRQVAAESKILSENKLSEIVRGWSEPSEEEKRALVRVLKRPADELFQEASHPHVAA